MELQISESIKELTQVFQPSWVIQGWSDIGAIATALSAIFTLIVVFLTWRSLKATQKTVTEMIKNRLENSRPVVVVDYEVREGIVSLYIENIGQTTARDIAVVIPKPIKVRGYEKDVRVLLFKEPIKSLSPGRKISTIINGLRSITEEEGYSLQQDISVRYNDGDGHSYDEPSTLNIEIHKSTLYTDSNETKITRHLEVIAEELKEIRQAVNPVKPLEDKEALQSLLEMVEEANTCKK